ncbi:MAG: hypothetical protein WC241_04230 [Candidatus Paceibacterota bacterium]|jgi:hypothetical protein
MEKDKGDYGLLYPIDILEEQENELSDKEIIISGDDGFYDDTFVSA